MKQQVKPTGVNRRSHPILKHFVEVLDVGFMCYRLLELNPVRSSLIGSL